MERGRQQAHKIGRGSLAHRKDEDKRLKMLAADWGVPSIRESREQLGQGRCSVWSIAARSAVVERDVAAAAALGPVYLIIA
jgi:hypothetical protein